MGESSDTPLKLQFDARVRLDFVALPSPRTPDSWHAASLMPLWGSQRQPTIISMKAAPAAMCNTGCCPCSDNRCIAVSLATRTPTTLNGLPQTRLCVSSSGGKVLISRQPAPTL